MRDNIVKGERHSLPKECRQQVRSQLFQQRENIDFDPHLKKDCAPEINEFCKEVPHGSGQVNRPNASVVAIFIHTFFIPWVLSSALLIYCRSSL